MLNKGLPLDASSGLEASTPLLKQAGTNVVVQVLAAEEVQAQGACLRPTGGDGVEIALRDETLALARDPGETEAAVRAGQIAVLLSMEGAHGLGVGPDWAEVFDQFYDRGLRLMGITWSFSNRFAGSSGDGGRVSPRRDEPSLPTLEQSASSWMCPTPAARPRSRSAGTVPQPVIASHSNAHGLRGHARNLSDEEIRCIAATGGVIGLNFHAPFVGMAGNANVARVADHADYLARVGGHGVVALGSDFDGYIKKPTGLEDASKVPALWTELAKRGGQRNNSEVFAVRTSCAPGDAHAPD